ncbi:hypothetical protein [Luteimonas sp. TWI1416]|uniref:hypothetical protein n=1 Tax=unclassified Luteimonas TaxID=2629088 RepID=UPI003207FA0F
MHGYQDLAGDQLPVSPPDHDTARGALIERFAATASDFGALDAESLAGLSL